MAAPLKDSFGTDVPMAVAASFAAVDPGFDTDGFVGYCLDGYLDLELTPRARRIADGLAAFLPVDRARALDLLLDSLERGAHDVGERGPMGGFRYLPHVYFVADHGLDHFERAMTAQYELTKRFTAEFSIRAYLVHHRDATLRRLHEWTDDPNVHVRRLVSEGTRPRLPWAPRLEEFQRDPAPVLELLERLRDDPEEYVRRSVANNLNDISKDHPELVVEVARRWWSGADDARRRLVRRALRTLVKCGDPAALEVPGYHRSAPVTIEDVEISPSSVAIGDRVTVAVSLANPSDGEVPLLVDLRIHFVKANGSTSAKVFKGRELRLAPGASATVRTSVSLAQHSTRRHHPGSHAVDVLVNGAVSPVGSFELTG